MKNLGCLFVAIVCFFAFPKFSILIIVVYFVLALLITFAGKIFGGLFDLALPSRKFNEKYLEDEKIKVDLVNAGTEHAKQVLAETSDPIMRQFAEAYIKNHFSDVMDFVIEDMVAHRMFGASQYSEEIVLNEKNRKEYTKLCQKRCEQLGVNDIKEYYVPVSDKNIPMELYYELEEIWKSISTYNYTSNDEDIHQPMPDLNYTCMYHKLSGEHKIPSFSGRDGSSYYILPFYFLHNYNGIYDWGVDIVYFKDIDIRITYTGTTASITFMPFNVNIKVKKRSTAEALYKVFTKIKGKKEEVVVSTLLLRSMMQARYSPECVGHFGLAAQYYCHFTSPIRRYPDLMVHRLLREYLYNGNINNQVINYWESNLDYIANNCSLREQAAVEAEREVDDMKEAEYMESHIGEIFEGQISGVTSFGMFVELPNMIEGLVHTNTLEGDYFNYIPELFALVGQNTKKTYRLGDKVRVKCIAASKEEKTIDFIILDGDKKKNEKQKSIL